MPHERWLFITTRKITFEWRQDIKVQSSILNLNRNTFLLTRNIAYSVIQYFIFTGCFKVGPWCSGYYYCTTSFNEA